MRDILTSEDIFALKRSKDVLGFSEEDDTQLFLVGIDSQTLFDKISTHFQDILTDHKSYKPKSEKILFDIAKDEKLNRRDFLIIDLFHIKDEEISNLVKHLLFYRDYISEKKLKLLFILNLKLYEKLKTDAYDFFSIATFQYTFSDHSYTFKKDVNTKLKEMIDKYKKDDNDEIEYKNLTDIGIQAYKQSNLEKAYDYFQKANNIAQKLNSKNKIAFTSSYIGLIYKNKGDLDQAFKYQKEALKIAEYSGFESIVKKLKKNIEAIDGL